MSRSINIVVLPYRDAYFLDRYGPAVRDLQILLTLSRLPNVKVTVLNKPVSIYERLISKTSVRRVDGVCTVDKTIFDLIPPFRGREWFSKTVPAYLELILPRLFDSNAVNVFLDFMPIGIPRESSLVKWIYWYDCIDNFTKHHRYTGRQRELVAEKYYFVARKAQMVTFVSSECKKNVNITRNDILQRVMTNKVYSEGVRSAKKSNMLATKDICFDFGFIGFITDKLDVDFIAKLAERYSIVLFGEILEKSLRRKLHNIPSVRIMGAFNYRDLEYMHTRFKVGLIPYRADLSHDGSPLKLYEYLKYNKPVVTSIDYELVSKKYIVNYNSAGFNEERIESLLACSGDILISSLLAESDFLDKNLKDVLHDLVAIDCAYDSASFSSF